MKNIGNSAVKLSQTSGYLLLELVSFAIFFLVKYGVNRISAHNFDTFYFGNFIVILPAAISLLGILLSEFNTKSNFFKAKRAAIFRFALMLLLFFLLLISGGFSSERETLTHTSKYAIIGGYSIFVASIYLSALTALNRIFKIKRRSALGYETVILMVSLYIFAFLKVNTKPEIYPGSDTDIAVVLGAAVFSDNEPSPIFSKRIERAAELFQDKKTKFIQVTGGRAPGEITEAKAAYNMLIKLGVPKNKILIAENTSSTAEQIRFINLKLSGQNNKIAIVSDEFHLSRIDEMCAFYKMDINYFSSENSMGLKNYFYYKMRESSSLLIFWIFAL